MFTTQSISVIITMIDGIRAIAHAGLVSLPCRLQQTYLLATRVGHVLLANW